MARELLYLHFGRQCPGTYFGEKASQAAELLQLPFRSVDISERPDLAEQHNIFVPGAVVIDDFQLTFPGSAEQMAESYRLRGPLPGEQEYEPKPPGEVDRVELLCAESCGRAFGCCLPRLTEEQAQQKAAWLGATQGADGFTGLVGYASERVVGFVEALPETLIPYPIGERQQHRLFITCLYSPIEWGLETDYRESLLRHLLIQAKQHGYSGISVISGVETPYPNGPLAVFEHLGFERVREMGRILLRHKWEDAWLLQRRLV